MASLQALKSKLGSSHAGERRDALDALTAILNAKTPSGDVWSFVESIVAALTDPFSSSSLGTSMILSCILKVGIPTNCRIYSFT